MDLKIQGRQKWRKRRLKSELGSITSRCSENEPALIFGEDQRPDPGDGGNRA